MYNIDVSHSCMYAMADIKFKHIQANYAIDQIKYFCLKNVTSHEIPGNIEQTNINWLI